MTVTPYHRGDLPDALVRAAIELLDEDGGASGLSLRAAARRAGVSAAAPYRHFSDRTSLLSAVAAVGYRELVTTLEGAHPAPEAPGDLADIAVAYVQFALARPALFRVMFAEPCHPADAERQGAADEIEGYLQTLVQRAIPSADPAAMATAVWALVHGLAFLHLDGKYAGSSTPDLRARIRGVVHATLGPHRERSPQPQEPTRC